MAGRRVLEEQRILDASRRLPRVVAHVGQVERTRQVAVVDAPGQVGGVEAVEDRPVGGWDYERAHVIGRVAACGAGEQEAAVGLGLPERRAEVSLTDRGLA